MIVIASHACTTSSVARESPAFQPHHVEQLNPHCLPQWVRIALSNATSRERATSIGSLGAQLRTQVASDAALVSVVLERPCALDADDFSEAVRQTYHLARQSAADAGFQYLARIWNFLPGIGATLSNGLDGYKAFNRGRYAGVEAWIGRAADFHTQVPTATGVGHAGTEFALHVLLTRSPCRPVENRRQHASYRYSDKYGPVPPCFARATVAQLMGSEHLLIGGTASIRGEDSVHIDSPAAQLAETLTNIDTLLGSTRARLRRERDIVAVRAYCPKPQFDAALLPAIARAFPAANQVEFVRAELCRPELLVEIEGVAILPSSASQRDDDHASGR